ncbi:MAG: class I SAM-dependent methyltransferase [Bacteroidales bacterium]|nr:class I SAM-dependent methyltransferase [Bacteroidales bacterium]
MIEKLEACPVCSSGEISLFIGCDDHFLSHEHFNIEACKSCGFKFTNPRPVANELGKYYQSKEYISHSNSRQGIFNIVYQLLRKFTIAGKYRLIRKLSSGNKILDIGCATGEFLAYMKSKGYDATGIEPDENARKMAKEQHSLKVLDETDIDQLPDGSFDVITLWHVLEHVSGLEKRMQDLNRLLSANGILIIAVPNANSYDAKVYGEFWAAYDVPRHLYHFSSESMTTLLQRFNFEKPEIFPMKLDSYYVSLLSEKYKRGKMGYMGGIWNGYCSNWSARKEMNYSSLIFASKKKITH